METEYEGEAHAWKGVECLCCEKWRRWVERMREERACPVAGLQLSFAPPPLCRLAVAIGGVKPPGPHVPVI